MSEPTPNPNQIRADQIGAVMDHAERQQVGRHLVRCAVCGRSKEPIGRYGSPLRRLCRYNGGCQGYLAEPYPGELWPGETREAAGA